MFHLLFFIFLNTPLQLLHLDQKPEDIANSTPGSQEDTLRKFSLRDTQEVIVKEGVALPYSVVLSKIVYQRG